ncbi:MAG: hydrolase 1, exosortase A system-associated [Steroidobacteraceae bacterium]
MSTCAEEPVLFQCEGNLLIGVLHRAEGACDVAVLLIVGGPQYRVGSHRQFVSTARLVAAAGFPVLRFDYRGMGDSAGEYGGFECVAPDVRSAIDMLVVACRPRRGVVLLGLCDAASAALMYCSTDPRVVGLILINPWVRSEQSQAAVVVRRYYTGRLLQADFWRKLLGGRFDFVGSMASLFSNLVRAAGPRDVPSSQGFIAAMRAGFEQFSGPALVVLSGRDLTADEFRSLCRSDATWGRALAREQVENVEMSTADHTFSKASDLAEFESHCRRWLRRHFGGRPCH